MEVLKSNLEACKEEKFRPYRAPAAPAVAAEVTKAISLYLVRFSPTLSAAMLLSRKAMMARPARLSFRFSTTKRVMSTSTKPAVKVEMVAVPVAPWAPLMMAMPLSLQAQVGDGLVAGEVQRHMEAMGVPANQQAVDQFLDDLAEGQRHNGG